MSDRTSPDDFERWLARELRVLPASDVARAATTARVMARVRAAPRPRRRRWAAPTAGLALAASLAGVVAVRALALVPAAAPPAAIGARDVAGMLGDTVRGAVLGAVRDTVRLVQFALVAPNAARVALAGDFNAWDPRRAPLARRGADGRWVRTVALGPGRHRYAFVVDDTQWVSTAGGAYRWSVRLAPDTAN